MGFANALGIAKLYAEIGADSSGLDKALRDANKSLHGTSNLLAGFVKAAGAGFAAAGAAAVGFAAVSLKSAISFESAFTGVIKTVDATDEQLATLRKGILDMSNEMPASASSIASVAEAAGQLGIKTDNVLGFTRVMSDLGVTTNLSATDAATALARFANITGMSQDNFDRLGSSVVALGNNLATTEAEIVEMGLRIAGAGSQVGMTEAQILGLAGSLSSVGIQAEAGGTAISRVMIDMASEVATGGEKLAGFAKVAGMSTGQFSKAFKQDAAGAIITFIQGLDKISKSGGNVFGVLEELGMSDIRVRDTLLRASGAVGLFDNALKLSASAWEENIALTKEAELRYGTTESKLQLFRNAIEAVRIGVGDKLLPVFGELVGWATDLVKKHGPSVIDWFGTVADQIKAVAGAFATGDFAGLGSAFTGWAASLWKMTRPLMMGFWIQLVKWVNNPVLRGKALKAVQRAWDTFTMWARGLWGQIVPALNAMWRALTQWSADPLKANALTAYGLLLTQGLWQWAKGLWGIVSKDLGSLWTSLTSWVTDPTNRSQLWNGAVDLFKALWGWAVDVWGQISPWLGSMWTSLTSWVTDASERQQLWENIKSGWNWFWEWAGKVWEWMAPILDGAWTSLTSWVTDPAKRQQLWNGIVNTWTAFTEWAVAVWAWMEPGLSAAWGWLTSWVTDPQKRSQLWIGIKGTWTGFWDWAGAIWNGPGGNDGLRAKLSSAWTLLTGWVTDPQKRSQLWGNIKAAWDWIWQWGASIWNGPGGNDGLGSKLGQLWSNLTGWIIDPQKRSELFQAVSAAWTGFTLWAAAIWEGTADNPGGVKAKLEEMHSNLDAWLLENKPNLHAWKMEFSGFTTGIVDSWNENFPKAAQRFTEFRQHIETEFALIRQAFIDTFGLGGQPGTTGKSLGRFVMDATFVIADLVQTLVESLMTKVRIVGSAFMALGKAAWLVSKGDFSGAASELGKLDDLALDFIQNFSKFTDFIKRAADTFGFGAPAPSTGAGGGGGGGFGGGTGGGQDPVVTRLPNFDGPYVGATAEVDGVFYRWDGSRWVAIPGRARGGPVGRGTYLVGEQGPELVTMGGNGHVYNADQTAAMLGGRHITVDLNVKGESNLPTDRVKLRELARALMGELQLAGMRVT